MAEPGKQTWLTVEEAWQRLQQAVPEQRPAIEKIPLADAVAKVLAETPQAQVNVPPADNSAMDGFALCLNDLSEATTLPISQRIPAGTAPQPLKPGSAARIFTGSEVPPGADTVVMQENCHYDEGLVSIEKAPERGSNIRRAGEDIAANQPLLPQGHRLRPQDLGLLAAAGIATVQTYRPLRVAVLATGDELIPPGQPLASGQIYESNGPMIAALLNSMDCEVIQLRAPDKLDTTIALLKKAAEHDAVITIGGVSVGEEDHVKTALNQLGETAFWKIGLKPGKPFLLGNIGDTPLLGLPGNPVSAFITFVLFCRPFLDKLQGSTFNTPRHWWVKAGFSIPQPNRRQQYLRASLDIDANGETVVNLLQGQSSAVQTALCRADVLAVIPSGAVVEQGKNIQVISLLELVN